MAEQVPNVESQRGANQPREFADITVLWLIVTIYPVWYWVTQYIDPTGWESLSERLLVSLPSLIGILALTFFDRAAKFGEPILLFCATLVMYHIFRLVYLNDLSIIFISGCYVAFFGMALGFASVRYTIAFCFLVSLGGLVLSLVSPNRDMLSVEAVLLTFSVILISLSAVKATLIRSRNEAQSNMIYAAKLATLGEMAGNIAHEINSPLAVILASADLLTRNEFCLPDKNREDTIGYLSEKIVKTTHRISEVITGLRNFSRNEEIKDLKPTPIEEVVEETLNLCGARLDSLHIEVQTVGDKKRTVLCNNIATCQILLNLINNSIDAMEFTENRRIVLNIHDSEEGVTKLQVIDNGSGVPEEIQDKVMLPFFTSKPIGKGTGLGLSVSQGLAEKQKGTLVFDKEWKPGASFTLSLMTGPDVPEEAPPA